MLFYHSQCPNMYGMLQTQMAKQPLMLPTVHAVEPLLKTNSCRYTTKHLVLCYQIYMACGQCSGCHLRWLLACCSTYW